MGGAWPGVFKYIILYTFFILYMTALLLFVLGFKLYNLILYIFFLISSEKAVQESEGILMVCEVGRGVMT